MPVILTKIKKKYYSAFCPKNIKTIHQSSRRRIRYILHEAEEDTHQQLFPFEKIYCDKAAGRSSLLAAVFYKKVKAQSLAKSSAPVSA